MKTEQGTVGGWGLALAIAAGLWVGCAPRTEIGEAEPEGAAGAPDVGNGGGDGNSGGNSGAGSGAASSTAGVSGSAAQGGSDSSEPSSGCFDIMTAGERLLPLGPGNQVFGASQRNPVAPLNYADQVVFDAPNWQLNANFPASDRSDDISIQLPEELSQIAENVGEVRLTRPECAGLSAAGRTVRVYAWWKLEGAIARTPTEGITLGTIDGESFADSTKASPLGGPQDTRPLNSRSPIVLEHTFAASDETDAGDLVLKLWLLEAFDFPSTLYINRIEWE